MGPEQALAALRKGGMESNRGKLLTWTSCSQLGTPSWEQREGNETLAEFVMTPDMMLEDLGTRQRVMSKETQVLMFLLERRDGKRLDPSLQIF